MGTYSKKELFVQQSSSKVRTKKRKQVSQRTSNTANSDVGLDCSLFTMNVSKFSAFFILVCSSALFGKVSATRQKKVFAHYLPWYDSSGIDYPQRTGWCYPSSTTNCSDPSVIHYTNSPLIGEYSLLNQSVVEYHLLLMHASGVDGIIMNINAQNPLQKQASLKVFDGILAMKSISATFDMKIIVSYDDGGGASNDTIDENMQWVYDNIYKPDGKYSPIVFIDDALSVPVFMTWSESNPDYYWQKVKELFSNDVLLLVRNPVNFELSDGNFEWVNYLQTDVERANDKAWGKNAFDDMDWLMARQLSRFGVDPEKVNTVKMGGVYPGFDDKNVPETWNGGVSRYLKRTVEDGDTFSLTWQMQVDYTPLRLSGETPVENPWVQITTWNDWPEGTSVEPATSDTYGYSALITTRTKAAAFKGVPPAFEEECLYRPYDIYELRKAGKTEDADSMRNSLFAGNCVSSSPTPTPSAEASPSPSVTAVIPDGYCLCDCDISAKRKKREQRLRRKVDRKCRRGRKVLNLGNGTVARVCSKVRKICSIRGVKEL